MSTRTDIAILAKAPVPGRVKSRLIPAIGAHAAAVLQERMTAQTVETALAAGIGPVTLWCAPDPSHVSFHELAIRHRLPVKRQVDGDLGARMLVPLLATSGPTLVIGTDCPAFTPAHLRQAAAALDDADLVLIPAEDGGYVLIGVRAPHAGLFNDMPWGTATVLAETRRRIVALNLDAVELTPLWDVDTESDLARLERERPDLTW